MPLTNSAHAYGSVTKSLHWLVFGLFLYQFIGANLMTRIGRESTLLGWNQDDLYHWHKSVGMVILALMLVRLVWRRTTRLPDWSPLLTEHERRLSHRLEQMVYVMLLALPVSGWLFVMAGDYGIRLFGRWPMPNPVGHRPALASAAWFLHVLFAYVALVFVAWHVGHGLKKHLESGGRFLQRMLPARRR